MNAILGAVKKQNRQEFLRDKKTGDIYVYDITWNFHKIAKMWFNLNLNAGIEPWTPVSKRIQQLIHLLSQGESLFFYGQPYLTRLLGMKPIGIFDSFNSPIIFAKSEPLILFKKRTSIFIEEVIKEARKYLNDTVMGDITDNVTNNWLYKTMFPYHFSLRLSTNLIANSKETPIKAESFK